MKKKFKLIFICKYNCFRSKVAESYFKKLNKNKDIEVTSAGFIDGNSANPLQKKLAKKLGAEIKGKPKNVSLKNLREQNLIIVVAKDVPKNMFNHSGGYNNAKFEYWKIRDAQKRTPKLVVRRINQIKRKVEKLVNRLENMGEKDGR